MKATRLAAGTVGVAAFLFAAKVWAAHASDSIGVLAAAADSGMDLAMSLIVLVGVMGAARPADREHPYGHGKFENVAGVVEAGVLAAVGVIVAYAGVERIWHPRPIDIDAWVVGVMGIALILDAERAWRLRRAARAHGSPAFLVDAWHFASDLVTTLVVLAGLWATTRGLAWADGAASMVVGVFLVIGSVHVGHTAVAALVDRVEPTLRQDVERAVQAVPGVAGEAVVRVRRAGRDVFVDATVPVARALSAEAAHEVARAVEDAVGARVAGADVVVHAEPVAAVEDPATTIKVLAARDGRIRGIHEIHVLALDKGLVVGCHIELGDVTVDEAHAIADAFEATVKATVPGVVDVSTHIEVATEDPRPGRDVTSAHPDLVERVQATIADSGLEGPTRVALFAADGRLDMHIHAVAPAGARLRDAHALAEALERRVLAVLPSVDRVLVHVEPS